MNPTWYDCSVTIGGVRIENARVDYVETTPPGLTPERDPAESMTYEATFTMDGAAARGWRDFMWKVSPNQRGVTEATLLRRWSYWGKKGRRAGRRLLKQNKRGVAYSPYTKRWYRLDRSPWRQQ